MATELAPKIRLVQCPKCRKLLPELADVPIYKCGGCSTLLQAKSPQNGRSTQPRSQEASAADEDGRDRVSETRESNSSIQKADLLTSRENSTSDQSRDGDSNGKQPGVEKLPNEDKEHGRSDLNRKGESGVLELPHDDSENDGSYQSRPRNFNTEETEITRLSVAERNGNDQNKSGECSVQQHRNFDGVQPGGADLSPEDKRNGRDQSQTTYYSHEDDDAGHSSVVTLSTSNNENNSNQNELRDHNGELLGDFNAGKTGDVNSTLGDKKNKKKQTNMKDYSGNQPGFLNAVGSQPELADIGGHGNPSLVGGNSGENSLPAGRKQTIMNYDENDTRSRRLGTNSVEVEGDVGSPVLSHRTFGDTVWSDTPLPSDNEQLQNSQGSPLRGGYPGLGPFLKSYYGSDSADDETDNHFPGRYSKPLKITDGKLRRDKQSMHTLRDNISELKPPKKNSFSVSSDSKPFTMRKRWQNHLGYSHGHSVSKWRSENEEYPLRMRSNQKDSVSGYDSGGPSNKFHVAFQSSSSYDSPKGLEDVEQERQELLRIVYKLEDQLSKTGYLEGRSRGGIPTGLSWMQRNVPLYYSGEASEAVRDIYHDLDYPGQQGRSRLGRNTAKEHKFAPIPYSGELTYNKHHIRQPCYCCPKDLRYSAPLPQPVPHHSDGLLTAHPGCYTSYSYYPSTPQPYAGFEFPVRSGDLQFNFKRNEEHASDRHRKEKHRSAKRHVMPTAGGAPFITCHRCFKLLHLPADFLVFKRRFHQLKCGSCSEVLRFFLHNRVHLMPYMGNIGYTPSKNDD